ncbi:MAG: hypothetical protein ACP5RY_04660 [Thermoplasmata archaeon]
MTLILKAVISLEHDEKTDRFVQKSIILEDGEMQVGASIMDNLVTSIKLADNYLKLQNNTEITTLRSKRHDKIAALYQYFPDQSF